MGTRAVLEIRRKWWMDNCLGIIILAQTISDILSTKSLVTTLWVYEMNIRGCSAKCLTQTFLGRTKCLNFRKMSEC